MKDWNNGFFRSNYLSFFNYDAFFNLTWSNFVQTPKNWVSLESYFQELQFEQNFAYLGQIIWKLYAFEVDLYDVYFVCFIFLAFLLFPSYLDDQIFEHQKIGCLLKDICEGYHSRANSSS